MHTIAEWQNIDFDTFHEEIVAANEPAIIRSLVDDWPAVERCGRSGAAACNYIEGLDDGASVYTIAAPPSANGRFFYSDDLRDVNFKKGQIPLSQVLKQLQNQPDGAGAHAIAVQALPIRESLPRFEKQNSMQFLKSSVAPTMWIGTRGKVAPHYDVHKNLACVVAGRRQFILYPPDQISNLYPGPMLNAPGGVPISLVDVWNPDFDKFPNYKVAHETAMTAVLEPGDAIFIPSLWWHGVESLESINILTNYWWGGKPASGESPNDSLMHAMLTIANLEPSQQSAWRSFFDYYVFGTGDRPDAHLPTGIDDIVTSLSPQQAEAVRELLRERLETHD